MSGERFGTCFTVTEGRIWGGGNGELEPKERSNFFTQNSVEKSANKKIRGSSQQPGKQLFAVHFHQLETPKTTHSCLKNGTFLGFRTNCLRSSPPFPKRTFTKKSPNSCRFSSHGSGHVVSLKVWNCRFFHKLPPLVGYPPRAGEVREFTRWWL